MFEFIIRYLVAFATFVLAVKHSVGRLVRYLQQIIIICIFAAFGQNSGSSRALQVLFVVYMSFVKNERVPHLSNN